MKTYNPVHFDTGPDSLFIPAIPERPTTVGSGLDYRDRPAVLTTKCDQGNSTRYVWNEARRELVIRLYCNWPDKKEIDAAVNRMREQHGKIAGVVIYLALVRATGEKLPDRPTPEESAEEKALREAKALVRSVRER